MSHHRFAIVLVSLLAFLPAAFGQRFEWHDVEQLVTIHPGGAVEVEDTRTLWTDQDFGEAFLCLHHSHDVQVTLLAGTGALSPGPDTRAYTQACESGAAGTELVVEQERRVSERRVRFHYLLEGSLDVHEDVVQWYWEIYGRGNPPAIGYNLVVSTPSPGGAPYDAFVHRFSNREVPRVAINETRDRLKVSFDRIPAGEGVEVRFLMPPAGFDAQGYGRALERYLEDEARLAAAAQPSGGGAREADPPTNDPLGAVDDRGPTSASAVPPSPLRETRPQPLAVLLDNTFGYPQLGLPQATWIAELPVEGGATRLMAFFDRIEPDRVGPIRGARPYFVDVASDSDAVLVHNGGSPDALLRIQDAGVASLDALDRSDLFSEASFGTPPYNLFSSGDALRDAVGTLNIDTQRLLTGFRPVAPRPERPTATYISIDWSGAYDSGFRYMSGQDRYRWIRNGEDGVSAAGQAVMVDAVLIASITAAPFPGDPQGRLHIPIDGGNATLYSHGRAQQGTWRIDNGLRFVREDGVEVSLETSTTWAAFVPQWASIETR